jgi:serine/threonine protein kinase
LASPELQARFRLEALAAARLDHPHIVKVHEAGTYGTICYLAAELYSARTLADRLRTSPEPMPWPGANSWASPERLSLSTRFSCHTSPPAR